MIEWTPGRVSDGGFERHCGASGLPINGAFQFRNPPKDKIRFRMQSFSPFRFLTVKTCQPDSGSKGYEDTIEGNPAFDWTSGTEWGQARASRTSFMQETVLRGIEECEPSGGGMLDYQRVTADQDIGRVENDELVFAVGILCGHIDQCVFRLLRNLILALAQSVVSLRPGPGSPRSIASPRRVLSQVRTF